MFEGRALGGTHKLLLVGETKALDLLWTSTYFALMVIDPSQFKQCRRWNTPGEAHELTFSCYHSLAMLSKDRTRFWFADGVCRAKVLHQFDVWAYVIMPEHVHLLIWPRRKDYSTSDILKSIKQAVSRRAISWLRRENPRGLRKLATGRADPPYLFWQEGGGYDRNIRHRRTLPAVVKYIHANPVRRGLVQRPADWAWSSWRAWHLNEPGPIPIDRESYARAVL